MPVTARAIRLLLHAAGANSLPHPARRVARQSAAQTGVAPALRDFLSCARFPRRRAAATDLRHEFHSSDRRQSSATGSRVQRVRTARLAVSRALGWNGAPGSAELHTVPRSFPHALP